MCNLSNEVPQLFDWDQEKNEPADRYQRKELNHSVVEFVAPTEYMVSSIFLCGGKGKHADGLLCGRFERRNHPFTSS